MDDISLAQAKIHLGALVERARLGETINIIRHGKQVARLVPAEPQRQKIDVAKLKAMTSKMQRQAEPTEDFIESLRDDARY